MLKDSAIIEHKKKMERICEEIGKVRSKKKYNELKKCYHRLCKELAIYIKYKYNDIVKVRKGKWEI